MKTLEYTRNGLAIIAAFLASYIAYDYFRSVSLEPYRVISAEFRTEEGGRLSLSGVFFKNERGELGECELERFAVYGVVNGVLELAPFEDTQGWLENTSREAGMHSLAVSIDIEGRDFESVEARTRHICLFENSEGQLYERLVSRIFASHVIITER